MALGILKFGKTQQKENDINKPKAIEITLSDSSFIKIRDIIYKNCGIYFNENKKNILESKVTKRLENFNFNTFEDYIRTISEPEGRQEIDELFKVITINETSFFRSLEQFEVFEKIVVPEIIRNRKETDKPVFRIWSAASSTGEEAYSIAMIINEKLSMKFPKIQFQILASDISNQVIEEARKGIYEEHSLKNIPSEYINKYFVQSGSSYIINDNIKKMVRFVNLNLYDSKAMQSINGCDIIFCCNVLVYFDTPSKQLVLSHLYKSLNPGGYLFIGYSESLHGTANEFKLVHLPKAMAYKKA